MENSKLMRYDTQIQLAPGSMKQLNKQFALVDILLCYHGDNRNGTNMSKVVIEEALPSLYGIPIVGEWITKDDGSQDFGSHGGRIILDDQGFRYEQTTKPFGFITKDAVENAKWVNITEKDGHTVHEYLELKGCVVWKDRYEEVNALLDKNYGQSMEIEAEKYHYNTDDICVFEKITFSAACILGSHSDGSTVVPCFESACIGRHYELDSFKQEFSLMLNEYKKYINEPKKEEQKFMDLEKLKSFLSSYTFKDKDGNDVETYSLIGEPTDNSFTVIDKNDNFKVYSVEFALDDDQKVVADFDSKVERKFSIVNADSESAIDLLSVVNTYSQAKADLITENLTASYNEKISEMANEYEKLNDNYSKIKSKLSEFEAKEALERKNAHKTEIDNIVKDFAKKLGKSPKFLVYKAKLNYDDITVEKITEDLTLMAGREALEGKGVSFSYTPQEVSVGEKVDEVKSRYGNLLDKYIK